MEPAACWMIILKLTNACRGGCNLTRSQSSRLNMPLKVSKSTACDTYVCYKMHVFHVRMPPLVGMYFSSNIENLAISFSLTHLKMYLETTKHWSKMFHFVVKISTVVSGIWDHMCDGQESTNVDRRGHSCSKEFPPWLSLDHVCNMNS